MLYKVEKATPHSDRDDSLDEKRIGGDDSNNHGIKEDTQVIMDVGDVYEDVRAIDLMENGKEKPIENEYDIALRLISLDDDPTLPIWTFRMWFLSLGLSCFAAVLGQLFYFRPQTICVSQLFIQIISYVLGWAMEAFIPGPGEGARVKTPDNRFWRFMNPGKFNLKEHVAICIMATTASYNAVAISIFAAQDLYYNVKVNAVVGIFTLIASQLIGFGLAGFAREFLVYPTWAIYPQLLPTVQLFDSMHRGQGVFLQKKRVKFFWTIFISIFVWEWFPEYIAPTLTGVSIFCLVRRNSPWVTRIFGGTTGNEGLGFFSLCFDWNYVGSGGIGSLFTPLHVQMSLYAGTVFCAIAFCVYYARNVWYAENFPSLTNLSFNQLNSEKLAEVGPPWYAASQMLYKISRIMFIGAAITHFFLWDGKTLWNILINLRTKECDDVHYQKMKVYPEVPWYWFGSIFVICFAMALGTSYRAKSGMPWWALIVALIITTVFLPVIGTLMVTVGYNPSIENLVQMVGGAMIPGKPVANMYFTLYGYQTYTLTLNLLRDLKLGQYTKLPPRVTFVAQTCGAVIGSLLDFVVMKSVLSTNREVLLNVRGANVWSGQAIRSFNSAAISWGALGIPLYSPGSRYGLIPWMLLVGLLVPIPFWILHRRWPKFGWDAVFTPTLVAELAYYSGGITSGTFVAVLLSIYSQWYLRKYRPGWFRKYNFLLSAALDGGTEVMVFVFSFAVGGASGTAIPMPNWVLNPVGNPDYCDRLPD